MAAVAGLTGVGMKHAGWVATASTSRADNDGSGDGSRLQGTRQIVAVHNRKQAGLRLQESTVLPRQYMRGDVKR
jgi:hypothetical protein